MLRCFAMDYASVPEGETRTVQLGLPSLKNMRIKSDPVMMIKILTGEVEIDSSEFFSVLPEARKK